MLKFFLTTIFKHAHSSAILTFFQLLSKSIFNEDLLLWTDAASESQSFSSAAADTDNQLQKLPKLFYDTNSYSNKHKSGYDNTSKWLIHGINFEFSAN